MSTPRGLLLLLLLTVTLSAPRALAQEADLLLTKSGPAEAAAGSDVPYEIQLTNLGPDDAVGVSIDDNIPAGMTFVSATQSSGPAVSCSTPAVGDGGTVSCTLVTLAAGASVELTFTFNIPPATPPSTTFTNFVTKSSNSFDPNEENDVGIATTTTPAPPQGDLFVEKSAPGAAGPDTDLVYTITVGNGGPDDAENVELNDTLPGDLTFVSLTQENGQTMSCSTPAIGAGGTITCTAAAFAPGSATFTLTAHVPDDASAGTTYTNTATIASSNDPNEENSTSTTTTTVSAVDLAVTKSGPGTAIAGDELAYTLTLTNNGPDAAFNVQLTDTLPAGATFVSLVRDSGPVLSCSTPEPGEGGSVVCITGAIAPNDTVQLTLTVNAGDTTSLTNTLSVISESFDTDPSNDEASVTTTVTPNADLSVTKSGPGTIDAGANITYTITVANGGVSAATDVSLTDALPAATTFVSFNQTSGPTFNCTTPPVGTNGTVTCTIATFAANETATFELVAQVAPDATGSVSNTAEVSSTTGDTDTNDNSSTASAEVTVSADVAVTKDGPATIVAGTNINYTITVRNDGPSNAASVSLSDSLPAQTTFVSFTQTTGPLFSCTTPAPGAATGDVTCSIATLDAGATATFAFAAAVERDATGTIDNTASVDTTTDDPASGNDTATETSNVVASADLTVSKNGPPSATPGSTVTYNVAVTNGGPSDASNVTLTDALPANTTFVSATQDSGPTFNCTTPAPGATGTITCTIDPLAVGGLAAFTFVLNVAPSATGSVENTATVSSSAADPTPANNSATETTPLAPDADLSVTKTGPVTATAGTDITYAISIDNAGPSDAANVSLTDTLPAGTTFVSMTQTSGPAFTCTASNCTGAVLGAGATATFELVAHVNSGTTGTIDNTATVSSASDTTPGNNTSTASTPLTSSADLTVTKTAPAAASAGTDLTYTITVTNDGPSDATNVSLTDALPAQTTFVSMTQTAGPAFTCVATTCTIAAFAADATATFELVASIAPNATGTIDNTATVTSTTPDPDPANNNSTASTTIGANADLVVTKTGAAAATAGSDVTYTITVTNGGPSDATSVSLTDTLPAQTTFVSMTQTTGPAFTCVATTCTIATLSPGATATFELVVTIAPNATGTIDNTATVTSTTPDPIPANNSATASTTVGANADLIVTKTGAAAATAGTDVTYTVTVSNNGPSDAMNVTLTDELPPQTTFVSATQTSGPNFTCTTPAPGATGTITCSIATFIPMSSAELSFVVHVDADATGTIENTASVTSTTPDPAPANSSGSVSTAIAPATTDLSITKSADAGTYQPGATATYTLVVTNNGPAIATGVTVTDVLPAGSTLISATPTQGTCSGTTTVTCNLGILGDGDSATITLAVTLPTMPGPVENTATVTSGQTDPAPANNTSASTVSIVPAVAQGIPTLSPLALALLALGMAVGAMVVTRR